MVEADIFGEMAGKLYGSIFSNILIFGIVIVAIGILVFLMWYFGYYRKQFNIRVKIISERAGDINRVFFDQAAILRDRRNKMRYLRIQGIKRDLPIPKYHILQTVGVGRSGNMDYIEIYRTSEDKFYFLTPPIIDRTKIIKSDGKVYPFASQETQQIDTEIDYWNTKRKSDNNKMFDTDSLLSKLIQYMPIIIIAGIQLFVLYVLMDKLPSILSELRELAKTMGSYKTAEITTHGLIYALFA